MTTRVAIGCNTIRDYEFLAPLTGLMWRHVVGFEPIFFLVGDWQAKQRSRVAREALHRHDFHVVSLIEGGPVSDVTMSQVVRLVASMHPGILDTDWVMPGDADLWPLTHDWYYQHYSTGGEMISYYSNGDHYQTLPMCHVVARKSTWVKLLDLPSGTSYEKQVERLVGDWLPNRKILLDNPGLATWVCDQGLLTDAVRKHYGTPGPGAGPSGFVGIEREGHPPRTRVDRCCWPLELQLREKVDAHVLRPADTDENWPRMRQLFTAKLPQFADWVDQYRLSYVAGY